MLGHLNEIVLALVFSIDQVIYKKQYKIISFCTSIPPLRAILNIVKMSQNAIFQNFQFFFHFFAYS